MNFYIENIVLGVFLFFIIGIFHPIVIKAEYYFGKKIAAYPPQTEIYYNKIYLEWLYG